MKSISVRTDLRFPPAHVDMYAGLPKQAVSHVDGAFVLRRHHLRRGAVLAIHPQARFRRVRRERSRIMRWLDLHNLLGIVTVVWALTVGFTSVINTWADLIFKLWQNEPDWWR